MEKERLTSETERPLNCLIDLHLHLDGSIPSDIARGLAKKAGIELPECDQELDRLLSIDPDCRDLNQYLTKFALPLSLLQTKENISEAVFRLQEALKEQGLIYAEIRFAPQLHCLKGLTQEEVIEAALEGLKRSDFKANLILCSMRGDKNQAENLQTVELAAKYTDKGVCAVDLAGAEALYKTADFRELFQRAKDLGLNITIHAGEADGPESIRAALKLGAKRIGHGVRCLEDSSLVEELRQKHIPLEMCPTSNLHTAMFSSYKEYPLLAIKEKGIPVTLNTDNMTVSGTTVREEFRHLMENIKMTRVQVGELLINSAKAAFCDAETRAELIRSIRSEYHSKSL